MNNFNDLTEQEMLEINGGVNARRIFRFIRDFGEETYDFAKGVFKGFRDTARSFSSY